jgi:hypothetical protein
MIDLDSLRGIVSRATGTGWQAAYRQDVEALVAEVERLRNEVSLLQQEARIRNNINEGLVAELKAERAAVVAWLRDGVVPEYEAVALGWARAIERGEHRREETP